MTTHSRITRLQIEKYRSISESISIDFPEDLPLILVGENNCGKSNIVRSLELILGEQWPGSRKPDDHDFWNRTTENGPINKQVSLKGIVDSNEREVNKIVWRCNHPSNDPDYKVIYPYQERFVSNQIKEQCMVIVIGADRRLSYQLSYTTKWTLLAKLMHRFHSRLVADGERVRRLKDKFLEIKEIFEEVSEFAGFQTELQGYFDEMLQGMTYRLGIDFSAYDPSNFFHSLRVLPNENNQTRTFDELGTGQEQLLAIAFAHAYAKAFFGGIVLVIEEPEAHLHPLAQLWLGKRIREMAADGLQIVITTHSPAFVDILGLPGLVLVSKEDGATQVKQLSAKQLADFCIKHGAKTDEKSILPFYSSNATQEILSGFFAKKVILVEGQTEQLSLPIYFEKIGLDFEKSGIAIVPVMGKGNLAKWWRFFSAFDIPVYLIFDNDSKNDTSGTKRKDVLATLGILNPESVQYYLSSDEWLIENNFSVFGSDFETILRQNFQDYAIFENEAKDNIGSTKPLVARYVANELDVNEEQGWNNIRDMKIKIENLGNDFSGFENEEYSPDEEPADIPF
ncbi:MAG: AAA family ATPase [Candidatus Bathyarchaeia archaeon]